MNSLHAFKILSCQIRDSKGLGVRWHAFRLTHIKEIDKTPAVLFIPLAIDTNRAFAVLLFFNLMKSNTHAHLRNRCNNGRGVF